MAPGVWPAGSWEPGVGSSSLLGGALGQCFECLPALEHWKVVEPSAEVVFGMLGTRPGCMGGMQLLALGVEAGSLFSTSQPTVLRVVLGCPAILACLDRMELMHATWDFGSPSPPVTQETAWQDPVSK